jgi:hypothetical protein
MRRMGTGAWRIQMDMEDEHHVVLDAELHEL